MKRLLVLLLAGCALLTSCKEEDSRLGTRPGHDDAFVLAGDRLVPAHRYVVDFPAAGGTVDLKIVSGGIPGDGPTASSGCFGVELLDKLGEEAIYDYTESKWKYGSVEQLPRYLQTLRIAAQPNGQSAPKSTELLVRSEVKNSLSGSAEAEIVLRQAGAE